MGELTAELNRLRNAHPGVAVRNYVFRTDAGETTLLDLFGGREHLLVIHNMGQGCRYCTRWAGELNGLLAHLEASLAVVLASKDAPHVQRAFAAAHGWKFRLASHGGGDYIREQSVVDAADAPFGVTLDKTFAELSDDDVAGTDENAPGAALYWRDGDVILRCNTWGFVVGDACRALWKLIGCCSPVRITCSPWKSSDPRSIGGGR